MDAAITKLIQDEFTKASEKFPDFNSSHEGFAVLLGEIEELDEDMDLLRVCKDVLWKNVKSNNLSGQQHAIIELKAISFHAIKEAIQVAAMVERFEQNLLVKK